MDGKYDSIICINGLCVTQLILSDCRTDVREILVAHNVSSSKAAITVPAPTTTAIITGATLGSTCTINLVPLNLFAVGLGPLTFVGKYDVYLKNKELCNHIFYTDVTILVTTVVPTSPPLTGISERCK